MADLETSPEETRAALHRLLERGGGVLRCAPAWVARDFLPPGRRLGLPEDAYDLGERGAVCERWLASTTEADNRVGPADEGLSRLLDDPTDPGTDPGTDRGDGLLLRDAVAADPAAVMGAAYAASHPGGLGRLAKLFDYADRLPYHIHPPQEFASLVGTSSKDESYHFLPGVDLGKHPETFFGVHPWIAERGAAETLLPYLVDWDSDLILRHARAYLQVAGEGFHVPSGILHAPGTALTLELQEDSDALAMFQALNAGRIISKDLLFKDVRPEDRAEHGERFPLRFVDWALNGDPWFYENRHLSAQDVEGRPHESWVFHNSTKYAGKRVVVPAGATVRLREPGVHTVFVWSGSGTWAGLEVRGGSPGLDELVVTHDAAVRDHDVTADAGEDLVAFTLFGPDLHPDVPMLPAWPQ